MPKIVLWRPMYDSTGAKALDEAGLKVVVVDSSSEEDVIAEIGDADALWVRTPERVTRRLLEAATNLTVISTSGFGTDNVDLDAATELGILVVNHPGFGRIPVSEHTVMLILATLKQLVWSNLSTHDGSAWDQRSDLRLYELEGKTVGLIGLGFIGSEIARKLVTGFRADVIAYDPHADPRIAHLVGAKVVDSLDELLSRSTILALAPELNDETRHIIGRDELNRLPYGAFIVNCSRGAVVDSDALADAVDSGHITAAGLDVVYPEPLPEGHRLLNNPRVVLTPHTGGLSVETSQRVTASAVAQLTSALRGNVPAFPVNPQAWESTHSRKNVVLR